MAALVASSANPEPEPVTRLTENPADFDEWLTKLKDKSTQQNDIDKAHRLAEQRRNDIQGGTR